jgi:2,3-bisphosphoglycerate-independent phosphoglycerate mutase
MKVLFHEQDLKMTLGEVMEKEGKTQLRMAETEKYPHVTFFFSGGRELPFEGERRILAPSPKVATYDLQPEMSARPLAEAAVKDIQENQPDLLVLNFANPDMVGHTGVFSAVVKAIETVDDCARQVVEACLQQGYSIIVTADHGNADFIVNSDGSPNTAHTTNPVPAILVEKESRFRLRDGKLADLAPTILTLMGLPIPEEMTGEVLVEAKVAEVVR